MACDGSPTTSRPPTANIRDSADIEIVESHAPEWSEEGGWTVVSQPEIVIGGYREEIGPDSSHLVWRVRDVARLSDGSVAVLSGGEKKVLVFRSSGKFLTSFGRVGRGPGEFGNPEHLRVLPGDTLVVWDSMFGPVIHFDPAGEVLRDWRIDVGALFSVVRKPNQMSPERVHLPLADGSFVVGVGLIPGNFIPPPGEPYRVPVEFFRIDSTYFAHSLGRWEEMENLYAQGVPPALPFPYRVHMAAGDGPLSVFITNSDRYEVYQFSGTGTIRRIIRRSADRIPITPEDIEDWKEGFSISADRWEAWDRAMDELPPRRFRPPIAGLLVDSEGYLWVADKMDPASSEWSIFDRTGRWLGTLEVPLWRVEWIGEDMILGVNRDPDLGVQVVEGYRLNRHG